MIALFFGLILQVHAFPELTRHGYTQCTACHVAPNGGGVLTAYGREISRELLSTWNFGSSQSMQAESPIRIGGDVRAVQTHRNDQRARQGRFFLMQAELETAIEYGAWVAALAVGEIEEPMSGRVQGNLRGTEYYGMYRSESGWSLRAGRFLPQFGLNHADHTLITRGGAGFRPGYQLDTLEGAFLGEKASIFVSTAKGLTDEKSYSASASYTLAERYKLGASHRYSESNGSIRRFDGAHAILGFSKQLFSLNELVWSRAGRRHEVFSMHRVGYEVYRGVVPFAQYEEKKREKTYTLGMQLFPVPHFELSAQWGRVRVSEGDWADEAFLLAHVYF